MLYSNIVFSWWILMGNLMLLVGIGNVGQKYKNTVHNAGFMFLNYIFDNCKECYKWESKFHGEFVKVELFGTNLLLLKPSSYVNRSGVAVSHICRFYKIMPEDIIVIHDDIDIAFGKIKAKQGGGDAGHNGLKSIDSMIGADYVRIRIGMKRSENFEMKVDSYVVSKLSTQKLEILNKMFERMYKNIHYLTKHKNIDMFTTKYYENINI